LWFVRLLIYSMSWDRFKSSLGVIAWAYALAPALRHEDVRKLMMKTLRINDVNKVVDKANEVLGRLSKLGDGVSPSVRAWRCEEAYDEDVTHRC